MSEDWRKIAERKRNDLKDAIPEKWVLDSIPSASEAPDASSYVDGIVPEKENEITSSTAIEILKKIAKGELTALEVTEAFCHRAAILQQLTNCCSEIFFDKAFERAKYLDEYYKKHQKVIGPLHGIPISLKDQVNLEGIDTAIGYVGRLYKPKTKDDVSNIASILLDYGAVFFVKTTTPMAMMSGETASNIYGATVNSLNRKLSCGGSSGGEGAMVGGRGALIGFGTDIGGSIRIPSSFQGLYGLRGSSNRIPYCNVDNSMANQPVLCSVIGPMCKHLEDLELITRLILEAKPWEDDPLCPPIPWRSVDMGSRDKYVFGLFDPSSFLYVHPPVKRAMKKLKESLLSQGHEVVDWVPPVPLEEVGILTREIFTADGGKEILADCAVSGEPLRDELIISGNSYGEPVVPPEVSITEHWDHQRRRYEYQKLFQKHWKSTNKLSKSGRPIDALLCTPFPYSSHKCGELKKLPDNFTGPFNVLDYSVVINPVLRADKDLDKKEENYKPVDDDDKVLYEYYDPELYHGIPVSVQVVCQKYEEERAIHMAGVVTKSLNST